MYIACHWYQLLPPAFNKLVTKTGCFCIILWHFDFALDFPHSVPALKKNPYTLVPQYKIYYGVLCLECPPFTLICLLLVQLD